MIANQFKCNIINDQCGNLNEFDRWIKQNPQHWTKNQNFANIVTFHYSYWAIFELTTTSEIKRLNWPEVGADRSAAISKVMKRWCAKSGVFRVVLYAPLYIPDILKRLNGVLYGNWGTNANVIEKHVRTVIWKPHKILT